MAKKDLNEIEEKVLGNAETAPEQYDIQAVPKEKKESKFDSEEEFYKGKDLLIDIETYLKSGIHIGTKFKSGDMHRYLFKKRRDGLMVFNIETIDKRIRMAAKLFSKYDGKDIAVVCRKLYGHQPTKKFASILSAKSYTGRFIPGTFTNPEARNFHEPKVVIVCDPLADAQALKEAATIRIPVLSLAGSDSLLADVDFTIPANNKGRKSLALIFYLLTREILVERKEMSRDGFSAKIEDFEQEIDESQLEDKSKRRFSDRSGPGVKRRFGGKGGKGGKGGPRRTGGSSGTRGPPRRRD